MEVSTGTDSPVVCTDVGHVDNSFFSPGCGRTCEECLLDMQVLPSKIKVQGGVSSEGGDAITNFKQHKSAIGWERGWSRGIKDGNRED